MEELAKLLDKIALLGRSALLAQEQGISQAEWTRFVQEQGCPAEVTESVWQKAERARGKKLCAKEAFPMIFEPEEKTNHERQAR